MCFKHLFSRKPNNDTSSNKTPTVSFNIPSTGNTITASDIQRGYLRITKENKPYFPEHDCDLDIKIGNKHYTLAFKTMNAPDKARSHLLKLGQEASRTLELSAGTTLLVEKINHASYVIKKQ